MIRWRHKIFCFSYNKYKKREAFTASYKTNKRRKTTMYINSFWKSLAQLLFSVVFCFLLLCDKNSKRRLFTRHKNLIHWKKSEDRSVYKRVEVEKGIGKMCRKRDIWLKFRKFWNDKKGNDAKNIPFCCCFFGKFLNSDPIFWSLKYFKSLSFGIFLLLFSLSWLIRLILTT